MLDPERLLWTPGRKLISIPAVRLPLFHPDAFEVILHWPLIETHFDEVIERNQNGVRFKSTIVVANPRITPPIETVLEQGLQLTERLRP